jgi:hypothetical protein
MWNGKIKKIANFTPILRKNHEIYRQNGLDYRGCFGYR